MASTGVAKRDNLRGGRIRLMGGMPASGRSSRAVPEWTGEYSGMDPGTAPEWIWGLLSLDVGVCKNAFTYCHILFLQGDAQGQFIGAGHEPGVR